MKKSAFWCLLLICCACIAFTGGFFIGRNTNRTPVQVSKLPSSAVGETQTGSTTGSVVSDKVNINTATLEQLQTLPGIGAVLAQRIIDYREKNGPFQSPADLDNVSGIGTKILADILDYITTGG